MGFSLERALAGAVIGGAQATTQIMDDHIKATAAEAARLQRLEDARMLAAENEQLARRRAEWTAEYADKRDKQKRGEIGEIQKGIIAKHGGDTGALDTPAKLRKARADLQVGGYGDLGKEYEDDAQRIERDRAAAEDRDAARADRKAQLSLGYAQVRESREARASEKQIAREAAADEKLFKQIGVFASNIGTTDAEGKFNRDEDAFALGVDAANIAVANGLTRTEAARQSNALMRKFNSARAEAAKKGAVFNPASIHNQAISQFESQLLGEKNEAGTAAFNKSGKRFNPNETVQW